MVNGINLCYDNTVEVITMENIYIKVAPKLGEFQVASSLNSNIELQLLQDFIDDPNHIQPFFCLFKTPSRS